MVDYIFVILEVLVVIFLVDFGEIYCMVFIVLEKSGVYFYVCIFFGYWWMMNGKIIVEGGI